MIAGTSYHGPYSLVVLPAGRGVEGPCDVADLYGFHQPSVPDREWAEESVRLFLEHTVHEIIQSCRDIAAAARPDMRGEHYRLCRELQGMAHDAAEKLRSIIARVRDPHAVTSTLNTFYIFLERRMRRLMNSGDMDAYGEGGDTATAIATDILDGQDPSPVVRMVMHYVGQVLAETHQRIALHAFPPPLDNPYPKGIQQMHRDDVRASLLENILTILDTFHSIAHLVPPDDHGDMDEISLLLMEQIESIGHDAMDEIVSRMIELLKMSDTGGLPEIEDAIRTMLETVDQMHVLRPHMAYSVDNDAQWGDFSYEWYKTVFEALRVRHLVRSAKEMHTRPIRRLMNDVQCVN